VVFADTGFDVIDTRWCMSNYRRDQTLGGTWFFTVVAYKRMPIFCEQEFRRSLKRAIQRAREKLPFKIDAWILLPDHLHCVWTLPDGDANFSHRWKMIKQYVSHDCQNHYRNLSNLTEAKIQRRESAIWQRRFWEHKIRDEKDFLNHLNYIHYNPVKHGHCNKPSQWPYSSFQKYQAKGIYPKNWAVTKTPSLKVKAEYGE